jgi:hypothetical protein
VSFKLQPSFQDAPVDFKRAMGDALHGAAIQAESLQLLGLPGDDSVLMAALVEGLQDDSSRTRYLELHTDAARFDIEPLVTSLASTAHNQSRLRVEKVAIHDASMDASDQLRLIAASAVAIANGCSLNCLDLRRCPSLHEEQRAHALHVWDNAGDRQLLLAD